MFSDSEILEDLKGHPVLVVSFAGIKQGLGIPIFEFNNILNQFEIDKIFIRDKSQLWYQAGIKGASSITLLHNKLAASIEKGKYQKVVFLGNSMGGFAAILFGSLIKADSVIAFSPQTFIGFFARRKYNDIRWKNQIFRTQILLKKLKIMDLKGFLSSHTSQTNIEIHYSKYDKMDKIHAERLTSIKGVTLYQYNYCDHNLIKDLKARGELWRILADKLNE